VATLPDPRALPVLTPEELRRYGRHLVLPEVGMEGQQRLKASSVLLVGAGGLGSPLALYLAAAGVGRLGLVDFDRVDETNLQRQVLHGSSALGRGKLESARARLSDINPYIHIETYELRLARDNAFDVLRGYDVVADGTDNFATRYLVNDACTLLGIPNVFGSIFRFEGQATVFDARQGPCYRCLYPEPPPPGLVPSCAEGGVLGVLPGVIGTIQATETLKLILGVGEPLIGRLLLFDALAMSFRELVLRKDPECPLCGERPSITELVDYEEFCGLTAAEQAVAGAERIEITVAELDALRRRGEPLALVDVREPHEYAIAHIEGSQLIPLRTLPARMSELDPDAPTVIFCHHGPRSLRATELMRRSGFANVHSLKGGIDSWAREIDPAVPRY